MTTTATNAAPPKPKRRWFQFSLRTLLLLTAACAVLLWLWTVYVEPYRAQAGAATALRELGCSVTTEPAGPAWLGKLVGEDLVKVVECKFYRKAITDADLMHLKGLSNLRTLVVFDRVVTDAEFEQLKSMTNLKLLVLHRTMIGEIEKSLPKTHVYRGPECPVP